MAQAQRKVGLRVDDGRQKQDDELPPPIEMGQQETSYGSSYSETFPGQVTANRRNAATKETGEDDSADDQRETEAGS
jgi:hypothetical protein